MSTGLNGKSKPTGRLGLASVLPMKIGDLVWLKGTQTNVGIVIGTLTGHGYLDYRKMDGRVVFSHHRSLEVLSEAR